MRVYVQRSKYERKIFIRTKKEGPWLAIITEGIDDIFRELGPGAGAYYTLRPVKKNK